MNVIQGKTIFVAFLLCDENQWKLFYVYDYLIYSLSFVSPPVGSLRIGTNDQLPVGLMAQLVRAPHWYRRALGFEFRLSLNLFNLFFYQLLKLISLTARAVVISYFIRSSHIRLFHIFTVICKLYHVTSFIGRDYWSIILPHLIFLISYSSALSHTTSRHEFVSFQLCLSRAWYKQDGIDHVSHRQ